MTDITQIKRMLADRALEIASMLLPGGRKDGSEWRSGSTAGEKGDSLGVHLTGTKAGIWSDFATGEKGDLLDLWCLARGMPLSGALEAARGYLGIQRHEPYRDPKPAYTRPPRPSCVKPKAKVLDYLTQDRNIPQAILDLYKIGEDGDRIVFPFLLPDGTLAMAKTREAVDGADCKPTAANCEPVAFGWQAIPENAREVTITEGEIDALSMAAYGFPTVSVPFGGGGGRKQQWIENDFERLERFERIYLSTDMDDTGEKASFEIAARLGRHRCFRVVLPRKDANECLVVGVGKEEIAACVRGAQSLDPEGLKSVSAYADKVIRLFWPQDGEHIGYSLPYSALHHKLLFRPGELTLWSGATGSGKSQIISDCIPKWIQEGSRVCVASFEMQPQWTLKRLVKQAGGVDRPSEPFIRRILEWLDQGVLLYEKVGKADVPKVLEIFDYARAKYGCDQFVIDSFMRLGIPKDDYNAQEQAAFRLTDWAIASNVHLHLVAHARKTGSDFGGGILRSQDVRGAGEIGDNAFNILLIQRNKDHEERLRDAKTPEERAEVDQKAGVGLNIDKQRNGDFEGLVKLWFMPETYQYYSTTDDRKWPRNYLRNAKAEDVTA